MVNRLSIALAIGRWTGNQQLMLAPFKRLSKKQMASALRVNNLGITRQLEDLEGSRDDVFRDNEGYTRVVRTYRHNSPCVAHRTDYIYDSEGRLKSQESRIGQNGVPYQILHPTRYFQNPKRAKV